MGFVRLIGHTDNTGYEQHNVGLRDRCARAVKEARENILKEDMLTRRIQVAIVAKKGPGPNKPKPDNRTKEGRALNRRVVFTAPLIPPIPQPEPKKPLITTITDLPPDPVIKAKPDPYWKPIPPKGKSKSFKQWFNKRLSRVPKVLCDKIWQVIFGKDVSVLSILLDQAGFGAAEKKAVFERIDQLAETPTP